MRMVGVKKSGYINYEAELMEALAEAEEDVRQLITFLSKPLDLDR